MDNSPSKEAILLKIANDIVSELYLEFVDMEPTPCKALLECASVALSEVIHVYEFTSNLKRNG